MDVGKPFQIDIIPVILNRHSIQIDVVITYIVTT